MFCIAIDLQWKKVKIDLYYRLAADILTNVLQKCSWSSPLQIIFIQTS